MADRVLPSRDSFSDADIKTLYKHGFFDEEKIIMAYVSGRLVDREALDYEAMARKVYALVRSAYNQFPDEPRKPWDDLDEISKTGLIAMAQSRVDAAIGDTDD